MVWSAASRIQLFMAIVKQDDEETDRNYQNQSSQYGAKKKNWLFETALKPTLQSSIRGSNVYFLPCWSLEEIGCNLKKKWNKQWER